MFGWKKKPEVVFHHPQPSATSAVLVLFSEVVSAEQIETHLFKVLGESFTVKRGNRVLAVEGRGVWTPIQILPGPVPDDQALNQCPPMLWDDTAVVRDHRGAVLIAATSAAPDVPAEDPRAKARQIRKVQSQVIAGVLAMDGAVAVFNSSAETTYPGDYYIRIVREWADSADGFPAPLWFGVCLELDEADTTSGYSYGLTELGHAEFQVTNSHQSQQDLFVMLLGVAGMVAAGDTLVPGATVGLSETQKLAVTAVPSRSNPDVQALAIAW